MKFFLGSLVLLFCLAALALANPATVEHREKRDLPPGVIASLLG